MNMALSFLWWGLCREWKEIVDQWVSTTKEIAGNLTLSFSIFLLSYEDSRLTVCLVSRNRSISIWF